MWDSHLRGISVKKYSIQLSPGKVRSVHFGPYREGPRVCEWEKSERDKILKMGVIELVEAKWYALVVFAPETH